MLKKTVTLIAILLPGLLFGARGQYGVSSPDGRVRVQVSVAGNIGYSVSYDSGCLVSGHMAISTGAGEFGRDFRVRKSVTRHIDETFPTPVYKRAAEHNVCNELTLVGCKDYDLVVRAYDEGAAWRFVYKGRKDLTVFSEDVEFDLGADRCAYIPYVKKTGSFDIQFFNTFENVYAHTPVSEWRKGQLAFLPLLVEADGGVKFCITESDLEHYPGMYLLGDGGSSLRGVFAPYPRTLRQGSHDPSVTVGGHNQVVVDREEYIARIRSGESFPWRVIAIGSEDRQLLDNNLVFKLSRPTLDADFSWVRPGYVAWDWWNDRNLTGVDFESGVNNETYKYFIDFASANGIPYVVLDDGWYDRMEGSAFAVVPEIDLPGLIAYADKRGVSLMLWVGYYVFQKDMERIIAHYADMGVKGFKLDAIGRDDQLMNEFYYKAAEIARRHRVVLDFHGGAKPAGLNRTYPNVLNFEGVHGLEQLKNPSYSCDLVDYDVTFPFIRSINGPVDYTQGAMRNGTRENYRSVWSEPMSQGTRCRQIAEYIVFDSPLNMLCDSPSNYIREPECTGFITAVPTVWAETMALEGRIGEYETIARLSYGGDWYVGSLASWKGREAALDLSFLPDGRYRAEIFRDGVNASRNATDYKHIITEVSSGEVLRINIAPGGGYAIKFSKL